MYDIIAKSLVFGLRNVDKITDATRHDEGRIFATTGQFAKAFKSAGQLDNYIGTASEAAIRNVEKISQKSKVLEKTLKGVNWASNNVNPLLVGAAAYRVAVADKKLEALNDELCGMSIMFGFEALMKRGFESAKWKGIIESIKNPKLKTLAKIIQGLLFVTGSVASSTVGYKIGKIANNEVKKNSVKEISLNANNEVQKENDNYEKDFFLPNENKSILA